MTIARIGPVQINSTILAPGNFNYRGPRDRQGGMPCDINFVLESLDEIEALHSLINNPARRQRIGDEVGTLEWIEAEDFLGAFSGWYLLNNMLISYQWQQIVMGQDMPMQINGHFLGSDRRPVAVATHKEKTDDFTLTGVPLIVPIYPGLQPDTVDTGFTRAGDGVTIGLRKSSLKKSSLRLRGDTTMWDLGRVTRPHIYDTVRDIPRYGPSIGSNPIGWEMRTAQVRLQLPTDAGNWLMTGWINGAWRQAAEFRIRRDTANASQMWSVIRTIVIDDQVVVTLQNHIDSTIITAVLRHGDYGVRFLGDASYYVEVLNQGSNARTANYYLSTAANGAGVKPYIAVARTPMSDNVAAFRVQVDAKHSFMVGWEPAAPQADDAVAEQGKQFLYERVELLTVS